MVYQNEIIHKYSAVYLKDSYRAVLNFNFAIKFYGLTSNPARIAGNFEKESNKRLNFWEFDEFKQFIHVVDDLLYQAFYDSLL